MALGALISLSFRPEGPAGIIQRESKNRNRFRDIRPTAIRAFPLASRVWLLASTSVLAQQWRIEQRLRPAGSDWITALPEPRAAQVRTHG
jgi:hypothetical protein